MRAVVIGKDRVMTGQRLGVHQVGPGAGRERLVALPSGWPAGLRPERRYHGAGRLSLGRARNVR